MKEKRIPTQAGSSSRWEQLEECMREHVQQLIQALWEEGLPLSVKQPIGLDLASPFAEVQTLLYLSSVEASLEFFGSQAVLILESTQALGGPLQTQFQHPEFRAQSRFEQRFERNLGIRGDGDLLDHRVSLLVL